MAVRARWTIDEPESEKLLDVDAITADTIDVAGIIETNALDVWFQPIFSASNGCVYGYEALARAQQGQQPVDTARLFQSARETGHGVALDMLCRKNSLQRAASIGLSRSSFLFLNICPEMLIDPRHSGGLTEQLVDACGLAKDRIILEITEETAVTDYKLFCVAVEHYRSQGYKIAIDDFGVGYGGLKMLANIEPDFVKIDRHFVSNIDRAIVRLNLVDSIATACHRMGIKVIAEGIEEESDLRVVLDLGIELLQGFHLGRPSPSLLAGEARIALPGQPNPAGDIGGERSFIGDIARRIKPVWPGLSMSEVRTRFMDHPEIMSLPVVAGEQVMGMIHRKKFFEDQLQGRFGFGQALSTYKRADELVHGSTSLLVEATATLEDVAQKIPSRGAEAMYDDVCVTGNGKYLGTVAVSALLGAITGRSLMLARGANPLSGLPGNESIRREIEKRICQNMHFDVCYVDLDHFKPFNDHYGFEKGDVVLKTLANVITGAVRESTANGFGFAGHIGGDDFIVITRPQSSLPVAEEIVARFAEYVTEFHGPVDCERGFYTAANRKGEPEQCPLLSISVGIVSSEVQKLSSFAQLASLASEVKKAAKQGKGSTIVRDQRVFAGPALKQ